METKFMSDHCVELLIPRPTNTFYDRTGYLSTYGIWKILDDAYNESQKKGIFKLDSNSSGYRVYTIRDRAMYSPKIHRKISSINGNILYRISIASIGTTSFSVFEKLIDTCTEEVLVNAECKTVSVDDTTRRPRELPPWLKERWSLCVNVKSKLTKQEEFIPPDNAFRSIVLTRYSDTDNNGHVNHAEYYRFCSDCASEASLSAYFRHYDDDLSLFPVLETDVTFLGESPACVELNVFTWQDPDNIQQIYFVIYKKESKIFQARYVYYSEKSCDSRL